MLCSNKHKSRMLHLVTTTKTTEGSPCQSATKPSTHLANQHAQGRTKSCPASLKTSKPPGSHPPSLSFPSIFVSILYIFFNLLDDNVTSTPPSNPSGPYLSSDFVLCFLCLYFVHLLSIFYILFYFPSFHFSYVSFFKFPTFQLLLFILLSSICSTT